MEVRIDNILDMISSYGEEGVREDLLSEGTYFELIIAADDLSKIS